MGAGFGFWDGLISPKQFLNVPSISEKSTGKTVRQGLPGPFLATGAPLLRMPEPCAYGNLGGRLTWQAR